MKMTYKNLILITLLISLNWECNQKKSDDSISINQLEKPYKELYKSALEEGDSDAYEELSYEYMDSPYDGFLYTALIMANKHGNRQACIDVFYCLTNYYHKSDSSDLLSDLDERTRDMALEYLKLAAEKGEINAKRLLGEYYIEGKYLEKNEDLGRQLISVSEK